MAWWEESKELRAQVKTAANEAAEILTTAKKENRPLSAEEDEKFNRIHADIEDKNRQIERIERQGRTEDSLAASQGLAAGRQDTRASEDEDEDDDAINNDPPRRDPNAKESFLGSWARWGAMKSAQRRAYMKHLKPEALDALEDASLSSFREAFAVNVDGVEVKAAMSSLSGPSGEYTIEHEFDTRIREALKSWGGLLRAPIDTLSTATGNDITMLLDDDTSGEGEVIEENTAVTEETPTFSRATIKAYTYSSKLVLVPHELLQDTAIDVDAYLMKRFSRRIGRVVNKHATTGDGAKKITGLVTGAPVGKTAAGTTSVSYTEFLDLKHSVDPDYREDPSIGWMFNDGTLLAFKKLLDGQNRPLWQASPVVGEPPTIDGDRYYINQSMAALAASADAALYGALAYYLLRTVQGTSIVRLVERYAEKRQVGFFMFQRHDGQLLNPGGSNAPVKKMRMAA